MKRETAEIIRQLCDHMSGCDESWEGIAYSAFYQGDEMTQMAVAAQVAHLETVLRQLKEVQAAVTPVNDKALEKILKRFNEEGE